MAYYEDQKEKNADLIKNCNELFGGIEGGEIYRHKPHDYILKVKGIKEVEYNNLYGEIRKDAKAYFDANHIAWWGGIHPTGNTLSSQVACMNHLFSIRKDKDAVRQLVQGLDPSLDNVMKITLNDEQLPQFIAFEVVSDKDYLNEQDEDGNLTRGRNCTSIDALIFAKRKSGENVLIPIEWKYTESYSLGESSDKSKEISDKGVKSGLIRMFRYNCLIHKSAYLKHFKSLLEYEGSIYYCEPFYQLMRQTLWAEQLIKNKVVIGENEIANDYLHIHVIPSGNESLLREKGTPRIKKYIFSNKNYEDLKDAWTSQLQEPYRNHYMIVDPKDLFKPIVDTIDTKFKDYLKVRYW